MIRNIIAEQLSCSLKCEYISTVTFHQGNIFVSDTQIYLVICKNIIIFVKYLIHGSLIIQQIYTVQCIPNTILFIDKIILSLFIVVARYDIIQFKGTCVLCHFFDVNHRIRQFGHFQIYIAQLF